MVNRSGPEESRATDLGLQFQLGSLAVHAMLIGGVGEGDQILGRKLMGGAGCPGF